MFEIGPIDEAIEEYLLVSGEALLCGRSQCFGKIR